MTRMTDDRSGVKLSCVIPARPCLPPKPAQDCSLKPYDSHLLELCYRMIEYSYFIQRAGHEDSLFLRQVDALMQNTQR